MPDFLSWLGHRSWLGWLALVAGGFGAAATVLPAVLRQLRSDRRVEDRR